MICLQRRTGRPFLVAALGVLAAGALAAGALALGAPAALAAAPQPAGGAPAKAGTPTPAAGAEPTAEAPDSPRAAVRAFLDLTARRGDYAGAARYLMLPPGDEARGAELAWRLRAVLERHLHIDLDSVSAASEGNATDALPPGVDTLGGVPDGRGGADSLFVVRTRDASGPHWAFSRQTVSHIDTWYEALPDRWARDWLPEALQRRGPGDLLWWQWLALPALLLVALGAGRALGAVSAGVLRHLTARTPAQWDDRLLERAVPALSLLWAAAVAALLLPRLALLPDAHAYVRSALGALATFAVFWAFWRSVDVWAQLLMERSRAADSASARSLVSVTRNLVKVLVATGGAVATLAALGYPVMTMLAGLGIGGIALAFGAQKTIENLFGSIAIAADQPFRVGDTVRVEDITGTVERVGMRSTQIRTPDRTLVTLPNGKLADLRIEDFASRDRIRFATTIGLEYGTSETQLRQVAEGVERLLRAQPGVWPDNVVAKLASFGPSSLEVEVLCWFKTTDFDEFRALRQELLLGLLRIVTASGSRLALPNRTVVQVAAAGATDGPSAPQRTE
jgi:MscS family membrane protein